MSSKVFLPYREEASRHHLHQMAKVNINSAGAHTSGHDTRSSLVLLLKRHNLICIMRKQASFNPNGGTLYRIADRCSSTLPRS